MQLYHGSNTNIINIQLSVCRPYKDFGKGFYLTDIKEQALNMAKRVVRLYGGAPFVNVYEFNASCLNDLALRIKRFEPVPTEDWAEFIMNNRNRHFKETSDPLCNLDNKYDIVIGPVANDDISALFRQFTDGLISKEILVQNLTYRELTKQYSFHTEKAIRLLHKIGVIHE